MSVSSTSFSGISQQTIAKSLQESQKSTRDVKFSLTKEQLEDLDSLKTDEKNNKLLDNQKLGKDQYIRMLLEQLKNQNPLDPVEDKEFISQMAQFSALEEAQTLSKNVSDIKEELKALTKVLVAKKAIESYGS